MAVGVPGSLVGVWTTRPRTPVSPTRDDRTGKADEPSRSSPPLRELPRIVREFLATESAGGVVLLVATLVALAWTNSPWRASYGAFWHTELSVGLGRLSIAEDLRHLVDEALMAVFFLVVGLEVKRELIRGDLRDPRTAALPAFAAVGGMVVPALIYLAFNPGGEAGRGWGVPMATDIAFAAGLVALLGRRVPSSLKLFLLSLAVVDDIGAIVVIAVFYAGDLNPAFLGVACLVLLAVLVVRRTGTAAVGPYLLLGALAWLATRASGVHPTVAGVALGLLVPARPPVPAAVARRWATDLGEEPTQAELDSMTRTVRTAVSPAERLERALHPWASFLVVPVFALANAGIELTAASLQAPGATSVALGVAVALVLGKLVGITGAAWMAVRAGVARLPQEASWSSVAGVAAVGGIGFTVSLFVAELAFASPGLRDAAKLGVLAGSGVAAALGALVLVRTGRTGGVPVKSQKN